MDQDHKKTLNYLRYKLNLAQKQSNKIIAAYGETIGNKKPENCTPRYYAGVCTHIQKNWDAFMKVYISVRHTLPKNRPSQQQRRKLPNSDAYDQWYAEASMDGSLAYNGSSEDF